MTVICGIVVIALGIVCSASVSMSDIYEYDMLNRLNKVIYEDGSYVEYEYDANGNITNTYVFDATPPEEKEELPDDNGGSPGIDEEVPKEEDGNSDNSENKPGTGEEEKENNEEESGDGTETQPGNGNDSYNVLENIVTQVVESVKEVISKIYNWLKKWF